MSAIISECGNYRYVLNRRVQAREPEFGPALFVMLNPSTADATVDDATIRRLHGFSKSWGCNAFTVANLYALRSTDPKNLWRHSDPVGPDNDRYLTQLACEYSDVICAWGAQAKSDRVAKVCSIFTKQKCRLWCLGLTKAGAPKHPLYVPAAQKLERFIYGVPTE